jgi:hypothetical protein
MGFVVFSRQIVHTIPAQIKVDLAAQRKQELNANE